MPVRSISSEVEFNNYLKTQNWVIVDFYADWCGPCKRFAPTFDSLSSEFPGVTFCKVNSDHFDSICSQYHVNSLPTFILFHKGKPVAIYSGANETEVRGMLSKVN